jgi:hypothetical protein
MGISVQMRASLYIHKGTRLKFTPDNSFLPENTGDENLLGHTDEECVVTDFCKPKDTSAIVAFAVIFNDDDLIYEVMPRHFTYIDQPED